VLEVQHAGTNVEGIQRLGREKNFLARMMRRIGGQLALGQFQNCLARIVKVDVSSANELYYGFSQ
jgi:hypothetical protein